MGSEKLKDNIQIIIAWVIYFFVNVVFCVKYNPIDSIKPVYIILLYPLIVYGIFKLTTYIRIQHKKIFFWTIAGLIILFALFLQYYIDRYSVNVDRWSALAFWSENLKNGVYPYGTPTHIGGYASPYPVWQLFHFPFHLMGDTAYGQIFCLLIFFVFLFYQRTRINIGGVILLLLMSPSFWWEMSVRSDLLCNMLLLFIFLASQFYYASFWKKHIYLAGLITGLFLCTKMLVIIPLSIYFFPMFIKLENKQKILFVLIVIIGLVGPFVPFLIGENSILKHPEYNPMLQQTRQGDLWVVLTGIVLILIASISWKRMQDCFFLSGIFLFGLIFSVGVKILLKNDLNYVIFQDELDKSYFNVCLPFFLYFINSKNIIIKKDNNLRIES